MNLVKLNLGTLAKLKEVVEHPTQAIPDALKILAPHSHWELLTQKVGSNLAKVGEIELMLPLLGKSESKDGALSTNWTWDASAEISSALSIDLLGAGDLEHLPITPDIGHTLIVYGAKISADGKVGATTDKLPWGEFGVDVQGKRSADLRWYVQAKDDATLLAALDVAQAHFVWPNDLQGMLRMAKRTDWFGLEYEMEGEARVAIDVNSKIAGTGWTVNIDGNSSNVGLSLGIECSFSASKTARWKISAMLESRSQHGAQAALGVRIKLLDMRQSSHTESLTISAAADISGLTGSAEKILRANWPDLQNNKLLNNLTQPGTAIVEQLRELIDENLNGTLSQLTSLLLGAKPTDNMRDALVEKLSFGLADILDEISSRVNTDITEVGDKTNKWLATLFGKSGVEQDVYNKVEAFVSDAIKKVAQNFNSAREQLENDILAKPEAAVQAILRGLGEFGAQFKNHLDHLDKNSATIAVRDALNDYSKVRDKFLTVLTDSHRQKLELALSSITTTNTSREAAFEAWFRPDEIITPEAEQLFYALRSGRLSTLSALIQAAQNSGAIDDAKGWLISAKKKLIEQRVTLNFFGIKISSWTTWLRNVTVKSDLVTGNLTAIAAAAGVTTAIANPWKNRSASLGIQFDLIPNGVGKIFLAISLDGAFTARQEKTNRKTVQDLLNSYADATGVQRTDISLLLQLPSASDSDGLRKFWNSLTIAVPIALNADQWHAFTTRTQSEVDATSLQIALEQFDRRYAPDSLFSEKPLDDVLVYANEAGEKNILDYLKRFPLSYVSMPNAASYARKLGIQANDSGSFDRGRRVFMAIHRLAATVLVPGRLLQLSLEVSNNLHGLSERPDPEDVRKLLDPTLVQIQSCLAPVALVSETWLAIGLLGAKDEAVTWPFTSFVVTMAKLGGLDTPPGFVPIAQVGDKPAVRLVLPV